MTVKYNEYQDEIQDLKPSIKNAPSIRQIPVSEPIALVRTAGIRRITGAGQTTRS